MAQTLSNVRLALRNDTPANWTSRNPILIAGELGIEKVTNLFKIGDGVTAWNSLPYASSKPAEVATVNPTIADSGYPLGTMWLNTATKRLFTLYDNNTSAAVWKQIVTTDDLADLGHGDMLKSVYATNEKTTLGYVDKAIIADTATQLSTGRTIGVTGDMIGVSETFNGTSNVTVPVVLSPTGVTAGTYTKITVDAKGRVTVGNNLAVADIPDFTLTKITNAGTAASKDVGTTEGTIPVLGAGGKLNESVLPAIAITEVFPVDSQAAMLALVAQTGDVAIRSDINKSFILSASPASNLDNWKELKTPTDTVLSVNGLTGAVTLTTSNIAEGTNLYYTEARATANFNTNIAQASSTDLVDGSTIIHTTDTLILNCGKA